MPKTPRMWHIQYNPKPIPNRNCDFDFWADDYDGENNLCGSARDYAEAGQLIQEIEDNA